MAHGTYLTRNRHSSNWYARIVIPHDLRHAYDRKREIRRTLETPCKLTARRRALLLWLVYQQVFDSLRNDQLVGSITPEWKAVAGSSTSQRTTAVPGSSLVTDPTTLRFIPLEGSREASMPAESSVSGSGAIE